MRRGATRPSSSAATRERNRAEAQAAAPYAEELKKSPFTAELLKQAARVGFEKRTKVHVAWLGSTLRLEARERRLELRPTASGVVGRVHRRRPGGADGTCRPRPANAEEFIRGVAELTQ